MPSWRLGLQSKVSNSKNTPRKELQRGSNAHRGGNTEQYESLPLETSEDRIASPDAVISPLGPHTRSSSQSFPLVFGSLRKKQELRPEDGNNLRSGSLPNISSLLESPLTEIRGQKSQLEESEFDSGTCATCDSKLKWPRGITEFRCTICLMVNDLKPVPNCINSPVDTSTAHSPDSFARTTLLRFSDEEICLTLEKTIAVIDQCLDSYFKAREALQDLQHAKMSTTSPLSPKAEQRRGVLSETAKDINAQIVVLQATSSPANPQPSEPLQHISNTDSLAESSFATSIGDPREFSINDPGSKPPRLSSRKDSYFAVPQEVCWQSPVKKVVTTQTSFPSTHQKCSLHVSSGNLSQIQSINEVARRPLNLPTTLRGFGHAETSKTIFKQLEDMIVQTFGNFECLNASFLLPRPRTRPHRAAHSEDDIWSRSPRSASKGKRLSGGISDMDPKILLLGDVAENSAWWIGGDERTKGGRLKHDRPVDGHYRLVSSKSPQIDWNNLRHCYLAITDVGASWREQYAKFLESRCSIDSVCSSREMEEMDGEISEARSHVRRTLLKVCEALLKRPGRPLKHADDIRFLLIILANPLLHPVSELKSANDRSLKGIPAHSPSRSTSTKNDSIVSGAGQLQTCQSRSHVAWDRVQAFGVIKRTTGLLSNLPNDCHRCLTAWFSRFDENHFIQLIALMASFVTRRLGRQHSRRSDGCHTSTDDLVPTFSSSDAETSAQLRAAVSLGQRARRATDSTHRIPLYSEDWQIKAAARIMALLFSANRLFSSKILNFGTFKALDKQSIKMSSFKRHQLLPASHFYNTMLDYADLIADFDAWESKKVKFAFCQYPFFISMGAKIKIMEHDARRQMSVKAREAFFSSIVQNRILDQYLVMKVRRECLVEDSMKSISEVVGAGQEEIKKALKIQFINEEGIDAGGLRKEWFLLLIREIFDPCHGMFLYDEDSHLCYFNPHSFETSDQYFLVGALLGLAIYNSTILDVALPPFAFKKLLMSGPSGSEYRPALALGLKKMLEFEGDVQETFCRDFVADVDCFGKVSQVSLCLNGETRPVTNNNREEFVDLYVRYVLDTAVSRQFEPFKRGFFTVCAGNALSLFQPEEIEILIRGSDESLDVATLKAVAAYQNWKKHNSEDYENPAEEVPVIKWFWNFFECANAGDQRKLLGFITGSDRIPAVGATNLIIRICFAGKDTKRLPVARTCFNQLLLYNYQSSMELSEKLWRAVTWSEGFGLR